MPDLIGKKSIKPLRTYTQIDRCSAIEIWLSLRQAIDEIHNRNASCLSFEDLYRSAYNLVLHKHGDLLYEGVCDRLSSQLLRASEKLAEVPDSTLLLEVASSYKGHKVTMLMIQDILMYMDRTYVQHKKMRPIYELGLHLFRIKVWENPCVHSRVTELLLKVISDERAGLQTGDRCVLKSVLMMLQELGSADNSNVYERDFGNIFLGTTQEFYQKETSNYLGLNTASDYILRAKCRFEEENLRASSLSLPKDTINALENILNKELIEHHTSSLVSIEKSGFSTLLKFGTEIIEMRNMYDLFVRVPSSIEQLRDALCDRIKIDGRHIIIQQEKGAADPSAFVRSLLKMRERYINIVVEVFRAEKKTIKRLRESFEEFLNENSLAASCLSVYVDELFRSGLKTMSDTYVDKIIQNIIIIFRYLSDKDVFESYYRRHLAKRLLTGRSFSDELEREMVSQLKVECGYQFTSKLEGMFNDMSLSKDTRYSFEEHKALITREQKNYFDMLTKNVDIEVDVLTTGYWPTDNVPTCILSSSIKTAMTIFSNFYIVKHSGRKLSWLTSVGTAEIRGTFGRDQNKHRRYNLSVSTYQMCILLLFNNNLTLTLREIRSQTRIPIAELRRHLISLCTPRHRILFKGSKGKGINSDDDTFTFNCSFSSKLRRIRIPLVSMKDTSWNREDKIGHHFYRKWKNSDIDCGVMSFSVEEDRRYSVDAAAVRIMKSKKSLHHNQLIADITKQMKTRFQPPPHFINKRIESLIDREYLERSPGNRKIYLYIS